jgi:hypothetical protein
LAIVDDLACDVASPSNECETRPKLPNYADRWCNGEAISTAFVESAVNQIISRRFVKKQQMRWTERGSIICCRFVPASSTTNGERRWRAGIPA